MHGSDSCFADRLGEVVPLVPVERVALARLEERARVLRRDALLVSERDRTAEMFIVRRGTLMSYVLLGDGRRQILRLHFPGDMIGLSGLVYSGWPESVCTLTEAEVCPFDRTVLGEVLLAHPRLATAIIALQQIERVTLTDRLAGVGRSSAKARVAALLLDIRNRNRAVNKAITTAFVLGLTQEEIGDATGLTAVHVNRMLRQLEDDGLIVREGGRVTLLDERELARAANYVDRSANLDLNWIPAPQG